jgi:molybdopterin synthase catalytic subunit
MRVAVQSDPFDFAAEGAAFAQGLPGVGAIVTFTGIVRDVTGSLSEMQIEHYPAMTERAITAIVTEALSRWSLIDALVIHRFGALYIGDPIMMVATAAPHRGDAFAAAEFLMDYLKSRAPFWKKEVTRTGAAWVSAKVDDEAALDRW